MPAPGSRRFAHAGALVRCGDHHCFTTTVYAYRDYRSERTQVDRTLALKLHQDKRHPTRQQLLKFGADVCHVRDPQQVIERIATAMSETLAANSERIDREFLRQLSSEWDGGRMSVALKS